MKLSTKGRYGARAMLDVATHSDEGFCHLKDIARRQEVSKKYLEHLVTRLEASGLLRTARGAGGGVALAKAPSEITLLDILHALEGSLAVAECVDRPEICSRSPNCATRDVWIELGGMVSEFLKSISLEELRERQRQKEAPALTYSI
ncbi:MAG: Rrf2 family transcriptional regulator [Dehalococcoidia bacterium]|nr:Rrf2 family transcriptional regulator [Dehalococcoidia bacterium]